MENDGGINIVKCFGNCLVNPGLWHFENRKDFQAVFSKFWKLGHLAGQPNLVKLFEISKIHNVQAKNIDHTEA